MLAAKLVMSVVLRGQLVRNTSLSGSFIYRAQLLRLGGKHLESDKSSQ